MKKIGNRVGLVGWRGMVGSVLMDRMQTENDFARIEPVFFTTSNPGGAAPAMADVLGNQIPVVFDGVPSIAPAVKAGQLRAIAVTSPTRSPAMPDVPTFAEAGVTGYDATSWFGISGPAGLPAPVTDRLSRELLAILRTPAVSSRLEQLGFSPRNFSPAEYQGFVRAEMVKWADVVRRAGIPVE